MSLGVVCASSIPAQAPDRAACCFPILATRSLKGLKGDRDATARFRWITRAYALERADAESGRRQDDLRRLTDRWGYAFEGQASASTWSRLLAPLDSFASLHCIPELYGIRLCFGRASTAAHGSTGNPRPSVCLGRHELRIRVPGPKARGGTARLLQEMQRALAFGLGLALDRAGHGSEDPRFRSVHGWRRSLFGLGPCRPRDLAFRRRWRNAELPRLPAGTRFTPRSVFAAIIAELTTPGGRLGWSPYLGLLVAQNANIAVGRAGLPGFCGTGIEVPWEDGLGFRHRLTVPARSPGGLPGIAALAALYPRVEIALASPGPRIESSCGHVLLVLRAGSGTPDGASPPPALPDLAVTPAARILGPRSVRRGIFGGYPSYYLIRQAADEFQDYQLFNRTVRCFPFAPSVSRQEREHLVLAVLLYGSQYQGNYRFFSENCASLLADLLGTGLDPNRHPAPKGILARRTPSRLVHFLRSSQILASRPSRIFPGKSAWFRQRLRRLRAARAVDSAFLRYLRRRDIAVRACVLNQRRAGPRLDDLFAAYGRLRREVRGRLKPGSAAGLFLESLGKDLEILVKRHLDAAFYAWIAVRVRHEFSRLPAGSRGDALDRAHRLEEYYRRRAREFMAFAMERFTANGLQAGRNRAGPGRAAREVAPARREAYSRAAARLIELHFAFRLARIGLAEEFFGDRFAPNRAVESALCRRAEGLVRNETVLPK